MAHKHLFRWGAAILLGAVVAGIGWIYAHPPLWSFGNVTMKDQYWRYYAIDLTNRGYWPLRLTGIRVDGERVMTPFAVAVGSFFNGEVASSIAMHPKEPGRIFETAPVPGWEMQPERAIGFGTYAVRLMRTPDSPPGTIRITYRYLGLPMSLTLEERP